MTDTDSTGKADYLPKWLAFAEVRDTGKTKVWVAQSKHDGTPLAEVRWHAPWRRYCMFPLAGTLWDAACLADIQGFIDAQMSTRKAAK